VHEWIPRRVLETLRISLPGEDYGRRDGFASDGVCWR
jgi:hypothetical protein